MRRFPSFNFWLSPINYRIADPSVAPPAFFPPITFIYISTMQSGSTVQSPQQACSKFHLLPYPHLLLTS